MQAERMVERDEVVREARRHADALVEDAESRSRALQHEAEDYVDQQARGVRGGARPHDADGAARPRAAPGPRGLARARRGRARRRRRRARVLRPGRVSRVRVVVTVLLVDLVRWRRGAGRRAAASTPIWPSAAWFDEDRRRPCSRVMSATVARSVTASATHVATAGVRPGLDELLDELTAEHEQSGTRRRCGR